MIYKGFSCPLKKQAHRRTGHKKSAPIIRSEPINSAVTGPSNTAPGSGPVGVAAHHQAEQLLNAKQILHHLHHLVHF
jgi:hypothetical protein